MIAGKYITLVSGHTDPVDRLASQFKSLTPEQRRQHVGAMFRILTTKKYATDLDIRIGAINVLLSLPEESAPILKRLTQSISSSVSCEVAFTLFLSLSSGDPRFKQSYIELAERYVMRARTNKGGAAFEAAYFLGSNCGDWAGVQSLFRIVLNGRTLVGRIQALRGLTYALRWQPGSRRREIVRFLRARAKDPNVQVRWEAESVLKTVGSRK
jgi:hypothetical protein